MSANFDSSVTFTIDARSHLVRLVGIRDPSLMDLKTIGAAVLAHPDYRADFDFLADCTAIEEPPTVRYVQKFVAYMAMHRPATPTVRWAQVVQPGAAFGMARMGGMVGGDVLSDYRVFSNVPAAERWLAGLPDAD